MARKVGGHYRDQYFEKYMDFLRKETDESREKEGKDGSSGVMVGKKCHQPQCLC